MSDEGKTSPVNASLGASPAAEVAGKSFHLLLWLAARFVLRAAFVFLLAKWLGAGGYGSFSAVLAVASFVVPLSGLGYQQLMLRESSRGNDPQAHLRRSLCIWLVTTPICSIAGGIIASFLESGPRVAVAVLFVAGEVASTSISELAGRYEQSRGRPYMLGRFQAALILVRLLLLIPCIMAGALTTPLWLVIHGASGLLIALWWLGRYWRRSSGAAKTPWRGALFRGMPFATAGLSMRVQSELNKPLLAGLDASMAGNLGVAQRLVDALALPMVALQEVFWPRIYSTRRRSFTLMLFVVGSVGCAALVAAAVFATAGLLPMVLGAEYESAVELGLWLCGIPLLQATRNLLRILTAASQ
ncbi:MAG: hypothetical protein D6806_07230, partial [Deltaproteobacteria bacterium]